MFRHAKRIGRWLTVAVAIGLVCSSEALGKKPPKPPEPDDEVVFSYELIDLFGFPGDGCQSSARFITHRDDNGDVLIGGNSVIFYPDAMWEGYPALWHVDINGNFPDTDPVNLGEADDGTGREARGLSRCCSGVMVTGTGMCFEQYEDGTWVSPSHVAFPDGEHRELPGAGEYYRNTRVSGINDFGQIVGTDEPGGGIWQLNADHTISGPVSLGEFSPEAINNFGVMAGTYLGWPAIAWFEDETLVIEQLNSSLEYWGADVNALSDCPINDERLTVVGTSYRDETGDFLAPDRGFAWRPLEAGNSTTVLGTLGGQASVALAVNTQGEIVGWSDTKNQGQQAFIFKDGQMLNLNSMTDAGKNTLKFAVDINDDGDIVGFMAIPRPVSEQHGFLLRPIPAPPSE